MTPASGTAGSPSSDGSSARLTAHGRPRATASGPRRRGGPPSLDPGHPPPRRAAAFGGSASSVTRGRADASATSNRRPSWTRRNRTGVPHSTSLSSAKTSSRACVTAASTGWPSASVRVELAAEDDRSPVGDLELHRDDGGDLAFDEARGDARERVLERDARAFAGVQEDEPQRRLVVEDRRQLLAADRATPARVVLEQEGALAARSVEASMADEVEDVERVRLELLRQRRQGRDVEPLDRDRIRIEQRLERAGQPRLLGVGVEELEIRWRTDDAEDPDRQPDLERSHAAWARPGSGRPASTSRSPGSSGHRTGIPRGSPRAPARPSATA